MLGLETGGKKWLFVFAHLDDETILAYGTIAKLAATGNEVRVAICCGAGRAGRDNQKRMAAFQASVAEAGASSDWIVGQTDLDLTPDKVDSLLEANLPKFRPDVVATHSMASLHPEHRMVAERVLTACRPSCSSSVSALLAACSPADSLGHGQIGSFQPDLFVDVSSYLKAKTKALRRYVKANELPDDSHCDVRSPEAIVFSDKVHGREMLVDACETWKLVFAKT